MEIFRKFDGIEFNKSLAHSQLFVNFNSKSTQTHHICVMLISKFIDITFFPAELTFLLHVKCSGSFFSKYFSPLFFRLIILKKDNVIYDSDYVPGLLRFIIVFLHECWEMIETGGFDQLEEK
jgi:hypothetical protein